MPNRHISNDLKKTIVQMVDVGIPSHHITQLTQVSLSTITCTKSCFRLTGSVMKAQAIGHDWPHTLIHNNAQYLVQLSYHDPTLFLDEYYKQLHNNCILTTSLATIHHTFKRTGINIKCLQKLASERDPLL
ncbi:hypothetical protein EV363DRAFT_1181971 [Boletus edulis]|nr:hypothetical protein EV363DRAFT_1181971 [Boletus edulis]